MRALIIDDSSLAEIQRVREHAETHRLTLYEIKKIMEGVDPPIGDNPQFVCSVPVGYRCAFSIEEHMNHRIIRHLSVSVNTPGKWPHPAAIAQLMQLFGFRGKIGDPEVLVTQELDVEAVNVLEQIE